MLSCSEDPDSMRATLELSGRYPGVVLPGLGLHPAVAVHLDDGAVDASLSFLQDRLDSAAFVGEVGLDYLHAGTQLERDRQNVILKELLGLAARARLPVCLHSRRAEREVLEVAVVSCEESGLPVLLHWFTHSVKLARRASSVPLIYMSAGPSVLHNPAAMAVAAAIAAERLLVETDAPVPFGGESARPAWIPRVVQAIACARGLPEGELRSMLDQNLERFLYSSRSWSPHPPSGSTHEMPARLA
jgi:TatD DNase family protein